MNQNRNNGIIWNKKYVWKHFRKRKTDLVKKIRNIKSNNLKSDGISISDETGRAEVTYIPILWSLFYVHFRQHCTIIIVSRLLKLYIMNLNLDIYYACDLITHQAFKIRSSCNQRYRVSSLFFLPWHLIHNCCLCCCYIKRWHWLFGVFCVRCSLWILRA